MGDDLRVANAARVSFDKESEFETIILSGEDGDWEEQRLSDKDKKLIRYLSTHNHFTPFTHTSITLRETVPIFVARQRFKHTVGFSYNEVSRRYVDSPPKFYVPDVWRGRAENKKQGSSDEVIEKFWFSYDNGERDFILVDEIYTSHLDSCLGVYNLLIEAGVAPEQARMVLPQSMLTSYYVTGSLAAFARAYKLRHAEDAQKEIQELSDHWNRLIRPLFPVSWEALTGT